MNKIEKFNLAMDILIDRFGQPSWIFKPKEGQNRIKIENDWQDYLDNYSEIQIEDACLRIRKWRKVNTFPNLYCLKEELVGEEKEDKIITPTKREATEIELWNERSVVARTKNNMPLEYTQTIYRNALDDRIKFVEKEIHIYTKNFSEGLKLAYINHYLDDFENFIHIYAEKHGINKLICDTKIGNVKQLTSGLFKA